MPTVPEDHAEIRNLLARYCLLLDHDDIDAWVELFTPDATYLVYGRTFQGHETLRATFGAAPSGLHLGGPAVIDLVDADHAVTQRNLLFVDRSTRETREAVYDEELVRTSAGWRIASCRCRFIVADGLSDRPRRD